MKKCRNIILLPVLLFAGLLLQGCAYYSFSGATIPSHLQTVSVPLVEDQSDSSIPGLDDELSSRLTDQFVNRTRLSLASDQTTADVVLECSIDEYSNRPSSVSGNQEAALNRVTIRVSARYYDQQRDSLLLDRQFSSFEEYDPAQGLDGESSAAVAALETLASDIFTSATSNW
jgi:outer membrane lipopolysaccharide assembly protein LptE/RlpB